ncbi:toxin HigB-2 [Actinobacillus equuli]|nr:toxin HigB-2 [Actinobacillus equuli]
MKLVFVELPPFERYRQKHLSDEEYRHFQNELLENPNKGDLIQGTNGLRKIRIADMQRNKGKRGGARVIYYHIVNYSKFCWLPHMVKMNNQIYLIRNAIC